MDVQVEVIVEAVPVEEEGILNQAVAALVVVIVELRMQVLPGGALTAFVVVDAKGVHVNHARADARGHQGQLALVVPQAADNVDQMVKVVVHTQNVVDQIASLVTAVVEMMLMADPVVMEGISACLTTIGFVV
ncbi:hypothetical protein HYS97_01625 [Candidatus Daviesbacteria bacterium]|nr:hypothetical protein [Candidatus Daviesbacteria bacterium]